MLNEVCFSHKKYSRFIKLRLNHCSAVICFNNVFSTFLDLESGGYIAVYGRVIYLSYFIKNILICVPKLNEGLMGVERHEGE